MALPQYTTHLTASTTTKNLTTKSRLSDRTKKAFANLRFAFHRTRLAKFLAPLLLIIPSFYILINSTPGQPRTHASSSEYVDSCSAAIPEPLIYFDPKSRTSSEFADPVASDIDPPSIHRIFATFFKKYLFQLQPGHILSITDAGRGRMTDVRDSLRHAERALRSFYKDTTIQVVDYSLGYNHLDRVRGSRYIFHLQSHSDTEPERHDVVAIQRTFDGKCRISVKEYSTRLFEAPIYLLVSYSTRSKRLKWFLDQFDQLVDKDIKVRLVLAVCKENGADVEVANNYVKHLRNSGLVRIVATSGDKTGFFSRAVSIRDGTSVIPSDSIMFVADIDMYIFPTMFDSCRLNSIQGSQVYFPVFYSLYPGNSRIDRRAGYWRDSSFGMSCMYKSDFDAIEAYKNAEKSFVGWGREDDALYHAFKNDSHYEIFRAIEPALRHKWHPKICEPYTPSFSDCLTVKYQQLGEMATVGKLLLDSKVDAQDLFADEANDDGVAWLDSEDSSKNRSLSELKKLVRRRNALKKFAKKQHANKTAV